jgi:hypothetical protein
LFHSINKVSHVVANCVTVRLHGKTDEDFRVAHAEGALNSWVLTINSSSLQFHKSAGGLFDLTRRNRLLIADRRCYSSAAQFFSDFVNSLPVSLKASQNAPFKRVELVSTNVLAARKPPDVLCPYVVIRQPVVENAVALKTLHGISSAYGVESRFGKVNWSLALSRRPVREALQAYRVGRHVRPSWSVHEHSQ